MSCDRKCESDVHTARIALYRRVKKPIDTRKVNDLIEFVVDLASCHPEDAAVQVDILPPGQFRVKSSSHFQKAPDTPAQLNAAGCGLGDPAEDLEQRAFARAIAADDPDVLAGPHFD